MPSVDLNACETDLREKFLRGRRAYEQTNPGYLLRVTATHRSVREQQMLFAQGRTRPGRVVTMVDGVKQMSKHNYFPSRAIDYCVTVGGKVSWAEAEYEVVGPFMEAEGLVWGGSWTSFRDLPHVELPA